MKSGYQLVNGVCSKDNQCNYEYAHATPGDTCGTTGNLDDDYRCKMGTCCFQHLSLVTSIDMRGGTGSVMPIYNRISNKSATCVQNNVTKYETICEGTAKPNCKKTFTPNGCVSNSYNNGFQVIGTEWGTCGCDTSNGAYETSQECKNATGKSCTYAAFCYKSCESQGYYSTEAACKTDLPKGYKCLTPGAAGGNSSCYVRDLQGFAIRYAEMPKRNWLCNGPTYRDLHQTLRAWLAKVSIDSSGRHYAGSYAETIDGMAHDELSDKDYRYEAGTYFVCSSRGTTSGSGVGIRKTVIQYRRGGSNTGEPVTQLCFADTLSTQFSNENCEKSESWGTGFSCKEVTFEKGAFYLISMYTDYQYPGWGYYGGTCTNY